MFLPESASYRDREEQTHDRHHHALEHCNTAEQIKILTRVNKSEKTEGTYRAEDSSTEEEDSSHFKIFPCSASSLREANSPPPPLQISTCTATKLQQIQGMTGNKHCTLHACMH